MPNFKSLTSVSSCNTSSRRWLENISASTVGQACADNFFVTAEATYDFLLGSADAKINGEDEDFKVSSLAIGLGVAFMF